MKKRNLFSDLRVRLTKAANDDIKNIAIYLVTALVSLLVIGYLAIQLINSFVSQTQTTPATYVTERELTTLNGYIIRKEYPIYSSSSGEVNYLFSNATKVGVNAQVAAVYTGNSDKAKDIIEIDRKIALLEDSGVGEDMVIADTQTLDAKINELYSAISNKLVTGDLTYVNEQKEQLLTLLNTREIMTGTVSDYNSVIENLKAKKENLLSANGINQIEVTTSVSGYFYNTLDGYENIYSAIDVDTMTIDGFYSLIAQNPQTDIGELAAGAVAIGKVANGSFWYIACAIPYDSSHVFTESKSYTVIFPYNGDAELEATLYRNITEPNSDISILVFRCGVILDGFDFLRNQTVEVVIESYSGYKVPISAIKIVDGVKGVYVLNGTEVSFREIEPLFEKNGYLIVEEKNANDSSQSNRLSVNEKIIIDDGDYYDGMLIG